jgi:glycosyltransferase involved in cell wall biosynthesis
MGMLGADYARSTWFRGRPTLFARLKPHVVRLLRSVWTILADRFVGLGSDEVRLSGLPVSRSAVVPWPAPPTGLALTVTTDDDTVTGTGGPVAFIGRFDPQRKGIDRLARWLRARAGDLPRPAAVLFATEDASDSAFLDDVIRQGILEWDPRTTGADLRQRLQGCRAVVMLSRWEAQARILREAALLGLPIITTDTGNVREAAEYLGNVVLVDGDDPAAIQRAFDEVDGLLREGKRARQLFAPENVGAFSFALLHAVATGQPWTRTNYYGWLGESS